MTGRRAVVLAVAAVMLVAGCGGSPDQKTPTASEFTVALTEPDHLTPGNTSSSYAKTVIDTLFDTLVYIDANGRPQMGAAESVTSTDQKVWTIKIKPGRKFSNGEPVTAQSFADAWNATAYGPNGWTNNYYFDKIEGYDDLNPESGKPATDQLSGLKVIDDTTLQVTLTAPFSQFPITLSWIAFAPMPKAAFADLKAYDQKPIGNGPFMIDGEWEHGKQLKVKRSPTYTGERAAKSDGVLFKFYASRDTAYTDLRANRVDLLQTIPPASVPEAKRLLGDRFLATPGGTMDYLGFPLFDKRFANPDLRKAFSMAIDRKAIVDAVYNGTFQPMASLIPPLTPGYRADACGEACTYDPVKARRLFDRAGGFKGTLNLWFSNADPSYEQWMTAVANQLKQNLGITDIKFRKVPASDYLTTLREKKEDGPYRQNWVMDYPSPQNFLASMWGKDNRMGWENEEFLKLIEQGDAAPSLEESLPLYQKAEDIALAEMPMIPLWNWQDQAGYSSRLEGVNITPYNANLHTISVKRSG